MMKQVKTAIVIGMCLFWVLGFSCIVCGNESTSEGLSEKFPERSAEVSPKVGVVLSGGGARGFAHIGALKVLEEVGIPIDCIVGTSMGSIVGGLYAIGYSAHEIETIVNEVDWEDLFTDTSPRNLWSYQKKQASAKYILGVGFTRKGFVVPQGLTAGQKISNLMAFLTLRVSDIEDFGDFPIPYRAVGTDIVSGEEVILDHGVLADAMRASMAVPGIFTPVEIDDHLLVDGGVVKNLPVDVAKQMGADIIIAIDVSSALKGPEHLGNPLSILNQMIALQILKTTQEQRELADLVVLTDLEDYTSTSFGNGPEIIALGEKSTRVKLGELQQLAAKIAETRSTSRVMVSDVIQDDVENIYVGDIVIEGNTIGDEQLLLRQLQEQKGKPLNPDLLEQKITEIFSSGNYETVKFTLASGDEEGKVLKLQLNEREQGTHLLRFGMNYESRFDDIEEDKMIFLVNTALNNLTGPGSSWSTDLQFVNVTKVDTEYIQPLTKGVYFAQRAYLFEDFQTIYDNKQSIGRYDKDERGLAFRLSTFLRRFGEISLGYLFEDVDVVPTVGEAKRISRFTKTVTSLTVQSRLDLLDTFPFPTSGRMVHIDYQTAIPKLGGDIDFHRLSMKYWRYYSVGRNTFGLRFYLGTDFKTEIPAYRQFILGGRDSFAGYKVDELIGPHLGIAALEYRYRLYELPSAVGGGIFATVRANVGNVWATAKEITENFSVRYGGSLGVGVDTVLGPVFADFAMGDGGRQVIYLNIGYAF